MALLAPGDTFQTSDGTIIGFTRRDHPRPDAPRLALIHSLALDRSVWDGIVERLAQEAHVLTYDCRGHGQSDRRAGAFTAELFAHDLAQLLDSVGWRDANVAGCSMGGCVTLAFAGLYPGRATRLGLIDTTAWYGEDAPAKFRERAAAAKAKEMAGMIEFQLTRWFSDAFRSANPGVLKRLSDIYVANDFDCYAASCALLGDADLRAHLPHLRMPVAIVVGEEDYATPVAMSEFLHDQMPQSTLTVIPKARHLTPVEHPQTIASELLALMRRS